MKFHVITHPIRSTGADTKTFQMLESACKKNEVECVKYNVKEYGTAFTYLTLPKLGKGDALYRDARGQVARITERTLNGENVATFYTDWHSANYARSASWFTHIKHGLPVVPSYPGIPQSRQELEACVESLGSFPIIIKAVGGSLGVGVMRVDSMKSLQSVLDYFQAKDAGVMLRKYIPHDYYVRAVVVGDEVVASHCAYVMEGEFRTNAGDDTDQRRDTVELSEEVKDEVVQAVQVLGFENGGVDLLFDRENGKHYIAEANFPNNFSVTQKVTGVDIAEKMIEHLLKKAK